MAETCIEFMSREDKMVVFSSDAKYVRKLRALMASNPGDVELKFDETDQPEGGLMVEMPVKWFRTPKPPVKRAPIDDDERARLIEQLARGKASKNSREIAEDF